MFSLKFSLKGFSTAYTSTEPGLSSLVKSEWVQGDWEKLQRVNAPDDAYHIVSGIKFFICIDNQACDFKRLDRTLSLTGHQKQPFTCTRAHLATSQNGRLSPIWRTFQLCSINKLKTSFVFHFKTCLTDCFLLLFAPLILLTFYLLHSWRV